jgi:hypothetical protein
MSRSTLAFVADCSVCHMYILLRVQSGKPDTALLAAVRDADDTELVSRAFRTMAPGCCHGY